MVCCSLFGCAGLKHPNWESVNEASTAYKQPCKEMGVDECNKIGCESDTAWFKKELQPMAQIISLLNMQKIMGCLRLRNTFIAALESRFICTNQVSLGQSETK